MINQKGMFRYADANQQPFYGKWRLVAKPVVAAINGLALADAK
jgi:enoyl-CoA hydratase/carnithine racemase